MNDESKDVPPQVELLINFIEWAKGTLILAACTGLLGFVIGTFF